MEARKIFRQYLFSLVVILCIGAFFLGAVSVKEKTQYNMDLTPYETVKIEKEQGNIIFTYGEKVYSIKDDYIKKLINAADEGFIFDFRQIFA
ncbi:MAG: hypothetical protein IIX36_04550 [Clostridia bacterium]|nr:hypothetical protein [Clostridia bacterium]